VNKSAGWVKHALLIVKTRYVALMDAAALAVNANRDNSACLTIANRARAVKPHKSQATQAESARCVFVEPCRNAARKAGAMHVLLFAQLHVAVADRWNTAVTAIAWSKTGSTAATAPRTAHVTDDAKTFRAATQTVKAKTVGRTAVVAVVENVTACASMESVTRVLAANRC